VRGLLSDVDCLREDSVHLYSLSTDALLSCWRCIDFSIKNFYQ